MSGSTRHVALLVHTANDWTRQLLEGVAYYASDGQHWRFHLEPRGFHEQLSLPPGWNGDGVILRLTHAELRDCIAETGLPAVNVSWLDSHHHVIPKVVSDERACATMAVDHLRMKGFKQIGYVGPEPELTYDNSVAQQCEIASKPMGCSCFPVATSKGNRVAQLKRWLEQQSTPIGLVSWDSRTSQDIVEACSQLELQIPHDVGIVCIEHDHLLASLSGTPISSIDQNPHQVGYQAAALLDEMMQGKSPPPKPILVQPLGVVCRQSTDRTVTDDDVVRKALDFIRLNYAQPIQVTHVCRELDVSRRSLENHFRLSVRSSPALEIRRARLDNVKKLLAETLLPLDRVAAMSGYEHVAAMMRAFKREFGQTAGHYRKLHYQDNSTRGHSSAPSDRSTLGGEQPQSRNT